MRENDLGDGAPSVWDGFELTVNARLRSGLTAQIGTTTGRGGQHLSGHAAVQQRARAPH